MSKSLPTYDQLPIDPKYPPHTAWGIWGEEDNYGTINLLTEERVTAVNISLSFQVLIILRTFNRPLNMSRKAASFH